ncbi:MAG: protein-L-isoaspartate O-methyltransferase [Patescibacteria group bacterium]|nr:protein-L-isoaspartate O-methyltransferase [Patescibacteria group bacterium]
MNAATNDALVSHLEHDTCALTTPRLKEAFRAIDRADFVHPDYRDEAYEDYPLPIGAGQTISQPTTVAFMLEKLSVEPGEKVLDVGAGSGWTTALLGSIVGEQGRVFGIELVPELVVYGTRNIAKYKLPQATIEEAARGVLGKPAEAPFDRILVSAAADKLPQELVSQLKEGGVMVAPVGESICRIEKLGTGKIEKKCYPGFAFVPLVVDKKVESGK